MTDEFKKLVGELKKETPETFEPVSFKELEEKLNQYFLINDKGVIKLIVAAIVANKINGDPVWLFLVAPSGGLKSELLIALNKIPDIYSLSTLTPQTFLSGQKGERDASLLPKVNNKILTFKDFTTILQTYHISRNEIFAQLREIYDGQYKKVFGTGEVRDWQGKIGFISGVTPVIDLTQGMYNILGQRFLQYRMKQPKRKKVISKSISNTTSISQIREDSKNLFAGCIQAIEMPEKIPELPKETLDLIVDLSDFITKARSAVVRDTYSSRQIELVPDCEMPTRFANQLSLLARAMLIIGKKDVLDDLEIRILNKISLDSIPQNRRKLLEILSRPREDKGQIKIDIEGNEVDDIELDWTTASVAVEAGLPTTTTRRHLEDLNALRIIKRIKQGAGKEDLWKLRPNLSKLLTKI